MNIIVFTDISPLNNFLSAIILDIRINNANITIIINIPRHPKRVWNALTGRYFIYPVAGTIGGINYDRNE